MKIFRRRAGVTLTELLVMVLVMFIFLAAVIQAFNIAFQSFQTNHTIIATRNYHAQVDFLFELIEKEIGFAGSMQAFLKHMGDPDGFFEASSVIFDDNKPNEIAFQYAAVEKILLKKDMAAGPIYEADGVTISSWKGTDEEYYFPIFSANLPIWPVQDAGLPYWNTWLIIGSKHIQNIAQGEVELELLTTPFFIEPVRIYWDDDRDDDFRHTDQYAANVTTTGQYEYIFVLIYKDRRHDFPGIITAGNEKYWGELISKTTIRLDTSTISVNKLIPQTIGSPPSPLSIDLDLMEHVDNLFFDVDYPKGYIKVVLEASFPGHRKPIEIKRTRYFWFFDQ